MTDTVGEMLTSNNGDCELLTVDKFVSRIGNEASGVVPSQFYKWKLESSKSGVSNLIVPRCTTKIRILLFE